MNDLCLEFNMIYEADQYKNPSIVYMVMKSQQEYKGIKWFSRIGTHWIITLQ